MARHLPPQLRDTVDAVADHLIPRMHYVTGGTVALLRLCSQSAVCPGASASPADGMLL